MVIPVLPGYLSSLGGGEYKGLIIALFTVTALLSRPFSGKLADRIGRVPVIMTGAVVCVLCSLVYPFVTTVAGLLWLRLFHGFSTGFTPTGQTAYLADIIPANKRGEGMGILGTAGSVGMAGGTGFGGVIENYFGLNAVFYASSGVAVISVLILSGFRETLPQRHQLSLSAFRLKVSDLFEPRVIAPCLVMVLAAWAYGATFTLLPDYSVSFGIMNKGVLFLYLTLASLTVRLIGGKASDRWGRVPVLLVSVTGIAIAMVLIATATGKGQLIAGVVLYGFSQGATSPTLMAWATDLSNPNYKGRGLSSLYMSMELGIGLGALVSGILYHDNPEMFTRTFLVCTALSGLAILYLLVRKNTGAEPDTI